MSEHTPRPDAIATTTPRWRKWLRRANPLGLVPAAIFEKEVRAQGRRWGTYLGRGLYAALMLGLMILVFFGVTDGGRPAKGASALQELQGLAPALTVAVLWFQYIMLALMGPLMTGPSICDERRAGTLATLLTTPLTASQIVLGKLFSAMVQIVVLATLATPMLLVIRVFGGVPVETILAGLALSISTSVLGASFAISASVRAKRSTTASVTGFLTAAAFHVGPIMALSIFSLWFQALTTRAFAFNWGVLSCGPAAMWALTAELMGAPSPPFGFGVLSLWATNCLYSLSLSALAIFWAVVRLRRVMASVGAGAPVVPAKKSARSTRAAPNAPGSAPQIPDHSEPTERIGRDRGEVSDRPVLWREVRQPLFSRARDFWIITIALAAIMIAIYIKVGIDETAVHMVPVIIGLFIVLVQAATFSSATITGEREGRTWDALLTTGLSPWAILLGKALGTLKRTLYMPIFVAVLLCTVGLFSGVVHPVFLPLALLIASAPAIFLTCTGVLASLIFRRSIHAAATNVGLALALWIGVPILTALLDIQHPDTFLTLTNPLAMMIAATGGALQYTNSNRATVHDLSFNGPLGHTANVFQFTAYTLGFWVAYAGAGLAALRVGVAAFNHRTGRSS